MPVPYRSNEGARAIAAGLAGVGDAAIGYRQQQQAADNRVAEIEDRQQQLEQGTAFAAGLAKLQQDQAVFEAEQQESLAPGGAGYAKAASDHWDAGMDALLGDISNPTLRLNAVRQAAFAGGNVKAAATRFETGKRLAKTRDDAGQSVAIWSNLARANGAAGGGADGWKALATQSDASFDSLPLPADDRATMAREARDSIRISYIEGLAPTDPAAARAALASPDFVDIDPKAMESLSRTITVEEHSQAAAARAEAAQQLATTREALATKKAELVTGAGAPQDWTDLADGLAAIGDTSGAAEARAKGTAMAATIAYRGDTLPQMDDRIAALTAKRNGGGLTPAEASELDGLSDLRSQSAARLNSAGGALEQYQFASGKPVTPLDPNDPASMAARGRQAAAAAARYGRASVEPILASELPAFKDMVAGSPADRLKASELIQQFGDARAIDGAAREIAGADDGEFRIAAHMPRDVARDILRGGDTLKSHPQVWNERQATSDFDKWYGRTLSWVRGSYRTDIFEAAKAFYAQRMSDGGATAYDPGRFAEAIETVLGRSSNGTGGVVHVSPNGPIVLVPRGMKGDDLLRSFARATPQDYHRASGGDVPRWADGSPVSRSAIGKMLPTALPGGYYGFRGPGGRLIQGNDGSPYRVRVDELAK